MLYTVVELTLFWASAGKVEEQGSEVTTVAGALYFCSSGLCVCVRACVRKHDVRACMRLCVRACVRVCACVRARACAYVKQLSAMPHPASCTKVLTLITS